MLPRAILEKSKLWDSGSTLTVSFYRFNDNDTLDINLNAYIAKVITEKIAPYINLNLVFDIQNNSNSGDIQIGYASDVNNHLMSIYGNKLGKDSLYTKNQNGVVSLYLFKPAIAPSNTTFTYAGEQYTTPTIDQSGLPDSYIGMSILRNFCYALGMSNEIRNPIGVSLPFNVGSIVASFKQQYPDSSVSETQLRSFYSSYTQSQVIGSSYDPLSIMNYTTLENSFLLQLSSYNTALSSCDKYWLIQTYPKNSYSLPNGETVYSLQQSCSGSVANLSIGAFEWSSPSASSDIYDLKKAGQSIAHFDSSGELTVPSLKISQPPSSTSQGTSFLSLESDGRVAVDSTLQGFKQELVGVVNGVIDRVNQLQNNQTSSFTTLSGSVQDQQSLLASQMALYEQGMSEFVASQNQKITDLQGGLLDASQFGVANRTHIDDLYLIQSTDRTNLSRYTDSKTKIVQDDLDEKNSILSGRVTIVENLIPPVQSHLDSLSEDMKVWNDIQTNTQNLQTQLITNVQDISDRFDQYQTLESKFASDILALNSRIAFTLDSFQSIQTVITQNYNNLAGQVLPAFAKIELLKQDVTFLKASSYVLIAILAVIVIGLFLYVFVGKKDNSIKPSQ